MSLKRWLDAGAGEEQGTAAKKARTGDPTLIATWNCNGLPRRADSPKAMAEFVKDKRPHVLCLQEVCQSERLQYEVGGG